MTWIQSVVQVFKKYRNTRLYRRLPAGEIEVRIVPEGKTSPIIKKIANWSPGGLFVMSRDVLPLETNVNLELVLDAAQGSKIQLEGQVVRHQQNNETGEYEGMGIMFTNFTQKGLQILRDLLLSATKQELNP
jgi:hypothetical protein